MKGGQKEIKKNMVFSSMHVERWIGIINIECTENKGFFIKLILFCVLYLRKNTVSSLEMSTLRNGKVLFDAGTLVEEVWFYVYSKGQIIDECAIDP